MKDHQKKVHAYDTIRHYSDIVGKVDLSISLLKNQDLSGNDLEIDVDMLKSYVNKTCDYMISAYSNISAFIDGFDAYDLTEYSDKTQRQIYDDKIISDNYANGLKIALEDVKSLVALDAVSNMIETPFEQYPSPVILDISDKYLVMINDWIDASYYTLCQIDHKTGLTVNRTDDQIKSMVSNMLGQIDNINGYHGFSESQKKDAAEMNVVASYVLSNLNHESFETIADYINTNIDKTPLIRRVWAL